jgi:hypothetical protein
MLSKINMPLIMSLVWMNHCLKYVEGVAYFLEDFLLANCCLFETLFFFFFLMFVTSKHCICTDVKFSVDLFE